MKNDVGLSSRTKFRKEEWDREGKSYERLTSEFEGAEEEGERRFGAEDLAIEGFFGVREFTENWEGVGVATDFPVIGDE